MMKQYIPSLNVKSPRSRQILAIKPREEFPWKSQKSYKVMTMFNQPFRPKSRLYVLICYYDQIKKGFRKTVVCSYRNEMSCSVLGPPQKDYVTEASLFNSDRESVLVFGGIDPHNNYGVARNTGKDVFRYVPDSNVWEYVGDLPEPRHHHSVAFLKGRVYLCGESKQFNLFYNYMNSNTMVLQPLLHNKSDCCCFLFRCQSGLYLRSGFRVYRCEQRH